MSPHPTSPPPPPPPAQDNPSPKDLSSKKDTSQQHQIDPALSGPGGDPRSHQNTHQSPPNGHNANHVTSDAPPPPVPLTYHPNPFSLDNRWQQPPPPPHQSPGFSAAVFQPSRYPQHHHHHPPPPPPPPHHHHHPDSYSHHHMPHRVDSQDRSGSLSHRQDDRPAYDQHPAGSHPSPPPIATLHNSSAQPVDNAPAASSITSSSPPLNQPQYYPPPNGPGMHSSYGYPPHARYPASSQDPHHPHQQQQHQQQQQQQQQQPPHAHHLSQPQGGVYGGPGGYGSVAPPYIVHTDDAATKLNDRVRRKCFNCRTTDTSTWRRSSLTPGKVLCNKCGLFERTHSRPRPEQFPHKRGPIVTTTFKSSRSPPPPPPGNSSSSSSGRLPPMNHQQPPPPPPSLPPHHYDHPSITGLMSAAPRQAQEAQAQQYAPPPPPPLPSSSSSSAPAAAASAPPPPSSSTTTGTGETNVNGNGNGGPVVVPKTEGTSIGSLLNGNGNNVDDKSQVQQGGGGGPGNNSLKRPLSPGSLASPKPSQRSPPLYGGGGYRG